MSTKTGSMGVSARPAGFRLRTAVVSGIAVTGLVMSAVALALALRANDRVALPAPRTAIASESGITGTGLGLIEVAQEAMRTAALLRIYSSSSVTGTGPALAAIANPALQLPGITGTGPGLIQVARQAMMAKAPPRIYGESTVTGTGPGLVQIAFDYSVPQVTGTGPGLVYVAKQSQGR